MTQPVQEPTQGRANQSIDFRSRQLFRRPNTTPYTSWAYLFNGTITVPAATNYTIPWLDFSTNDLSGGFGEPGTFYTSNGSGGAYNTSGNISVGMNGPGLFIAQASLQFDSAGPANSSMTITRSPNASGYVGASVATGTVAMSSIVALPVSSDVWGSTVGTITVVCSHDDGADKTANATLFIYKLPLINGGVTVY